MNILSTSPATHADIWERGGLISDVWQDQTGYLIISVTVQPQDEVVWEFDLAEFSITVLGTSPISYQWYRNGVLQVGETSDTYSLYPVLSNDGEQVYCIATDISGSVQSDNANLSVSVNPSAITPDDYFTREQPPKSEELKNRVEVTAAPLTPEAAAQQVYKSTEDIGLSAGESIDLVLNYSAAPIKNGTASAALVDATGDALTISSITYFATFVEITITNFNTGFGSAGLEIDAIVLVPAGDEILAAQDDSSILLNKVQKYEYPRNNLIQTSTIAQSIADVLLASYKDPRKDISITWRGDPSTELADTKIVPTYRRPDDIKVIENFKITRNIIDYDGTLKQTTDGRKV